VAAPAAAVEEAAPLPAVEPPALADKPPAQDASAA
jgi:hypothetical protein